MRLRQSSVGVSSVIRYTWNGVPFYPHILDQILVVNRLSSTFRLIYIKMNYKLKPLKKEWFQNEWIDRQYSLKTESFTTCHDPITLINEVQGRETVTELGYHSAGLRPGIAPHCSLPLPA